MSEKIIEYDFNFRYKGETVQSLSDVKGFIEKGKCTVLCGSSGCGKSTFLRCINHLIPQFYEGELKGFCLVNGKDTKDLSIGETGELVASVFQDPRSQFFTTDSSAEVAFGLENFGLSHEEIVKRVDNVYSEFGLEKLKDRNVFELSSGERQLVAILSAQALDTDIFLLDEPTANLDLSAIEKLKNLLMVLKERGKTLIINEHRLYYLRDIADEFVLMDKGKISKCFSAEEIKSLSEEQLAEKKLRAISLDGIKFDPVQNVGLSENNLLKADNIHFSYKKKSDEILSGVSLEAKTGDVIGLIGSNGSGKTTFGKLIGGLLNATSGNFTFNNEPLTSKVLTRKSIFIMQEAEFQFFSNSVTNELRYGREITPQLEADIERMLKMFNMWECRERHPFSLSGGQMQKLVLLLAYFSPKPIVILDEPTAGLDKESLKSCSDIINEMRKKKIVFIITHDLELISKVCTGCIYISKGKIAEKFKLSGEDDFKRLSDCMQNKFSLSDNQRPLSKKDTSNRCDLRVKFAYLLVAILVTAGNTPKLTATVFIALVLLTLYEKRLRTAITGGLLFGGIYALYFMFPHSVMAFVANYFPRFIALWLALAGVSENGDSARVTAALRSLHIPEKAIMIATVILRFFPVLMNDLKIMSQSIKTRDVFVTFMDKLKGLPEYCEIIIVPMMFRVIRIAEALSASAETRGIDLKRKRYSYIKFHIKAMDIILGIILVGSVATGLLI